MLMSSVGLRSENGCAGDARQKLKTTDWTSRQRAPHQQTPQLSKIIEERKGKNWSRVPDESLTPEKNGRLTDDHNKALS
jgi:hypothetical protein